MTKRRPAKFTPEVMDTVRMLAGAGRNAAEIAQAIGSTPASVSTTCRAHRVKLAPGRDKYLGATVAASVVKAFQDYARHNSTSTRQVVREVLSIIARDELLTAIFDGENPPTKGAGKKRKHTARAARPIEATTAV
jgi:hypothetical protein